MIPLLLQLLIFFVCSFCSNRSNFLITKKSRKNVDTHNITDGNERKKCDNFVLKQFFFRICVKCYYCWSRRCSAAHNSAPMTLCISIMFAVSHLIADRTGWLRIYDSFIHSINNTFDITCTYNIFVQKCFFCCSVSFHSFNFFCVHRFAILSARVFIYFIKEYTRRKKIAKNLFEKLALFMKSNKGIQIYT